ncbi:MAG TPA: hypothetical protein VKM55_07935 [Candidatus Lokiarchaeia archaeon]|nr:hypothetical protein [Candidatus Lokiarchaeia archaeon]
MSDKKRLVQVLAHPRVVKFVSIITALCIIATLAINGIAMVAAYELKWGFADSTSRFQPNIEHSMVGSNLTIAIPVYVNNTAALGFGVDDLNFEFSIRNSSNSLITKVTSDIGSIPLGTNRKFNVTLIDANITQVIALSANATFYIGIFFHVSYTFTTVTVGVTIEKTGGLL